MTSSTPSVIFFDSLVNELHDAADDTIGMLDGTLEVDPIFLLNALATAGLATAIDLDDATAALLARITRAARSDTARHILASAFAFADLGESGNPALTLDPDSDEIAQITTLHRLVEHSGLGAFADTKTRARLDALLDHNAAIVLMTPDRFDAIHAPSLMLRDLLTENRDHPARRLVDDLAAITSPLPPLLDFDRLATLTSAAAAQAIADLPWWRRLSDFATQSTQAIAAFLDSATRRPVLAFSASHGPERIEWPAPRYLVFQDIDLEVALLANTSGVLVEALCTASLVPRLSADGVPCPTTSGPLADAYYFRLPDEPDALTLTLPGRDLTLPWPPPASPAPTPAPPTFDQWRSVAPGAARALLSELAASDPSTARRRQAAATIMPLRHYASDPGVAHFPVVPSASDTSFPGALLTVRIAPHRPHHSRPITAQELAPALTTLASLIGQPTVDLPDLTVWVDSYDGLAQAGRSSELATLAALIGRLLDRSPAAPIIASGLLDGPTATPVDELPAKRALVAREAPGLDATLVTSPTPVTDLLVAWFGDLSDLTRALAYEPAALVRKAVTAWRHGRHAEAHQLATTALASTLTGLDHAEALWIQGAALLHKGDPAALTTLERARAELAALTKNRGPRAERFRPEEVDAYLGIGLIDALRPTAARDLLTLTRARLDAIPESDRDTRWDQVWVETTGSLARAHVMLGDLATAESLLESSATQDHLPQELARTLGDLGEVQRKRGHSELASVTNQRAFEALAHIPSLDQRRTTERFLRLYRARLSPHLAANYRLSDLDWRAWPQPAEVLERLLIEAPTTIATWLSDHLDDLTSPPPIALVVYRSALARAILLHGPSEPLVDLMTTIDRELLTRQNIDADGLPTDVPSIATRSPY